MDGISQPIIPVLAIMCMAGTGVLAVGTPVALCIVLAAKKQLKLLPLLVGAGGFVVCALVLEQLMHTLVLAVLPVVGEQPLLYASYGALAAAIFEEVGKYLLVITALKARQSHSDALSYGVGHGGIEAIFLGGTLAINNVVIAITINLGLGQSLGLSAEMLSDITRQMTEPSPFIFLLAGVERMMTIPLHMLMTLLVFKAAQGKDARWLLAAVATHFLADFPVGLYQKGVLGANFLYIWLALVCAASIYLVIRSKKLLFHQKLTGL